MRQVQIRKKRFKNVDMFRHMIVFPLICCICLFANMHCRVFLKLLCQRVVPNGYVTSSWCVSNIVTNCWGCRWCCCIVVTRYASPVGFCKVSLCTAWYSSPSCWHAIWSNTADPHRIEACVSTEVTLSTHNNSSTIQQNLGLRKKLSTLLGAWVVPPPCVPLP